MVDPPTRGVESDETVARFEKEKSDIYNGLRTRADLLSKTFNSMTNVTCSEIQGAMYAFPRIHLSKKAISEAKLMNVAPDFFYCLKMVEETGIMTVPGSGFGQVKDTYHFRITNLVCPTERMASTLEKLKEFNQKFHNKY